MKIQRLLVANRGEIALRIMRTARRMGIQTIAVYSEADANALHVQYADEAYLLGPAAASESYLNMDKIIAICKEQHIDAIHPGYGFLSERAAFAQKVQDAGIIFVGPPPIAIDTMGDKLSAKRAAKAYGVPLVPGLDRPVTDVQEAKRLATEVGFPILIKAAAGGGGKGMRIVERVEDFEEQMERAVSEATKAFGDGSVFVEKYVTSPRHIEIQVLADMYGDAIHFFERECSVQRRHQKVIEEAPSSILTPELRARMGEAAVNVCKACGYVNAGTVEFIMNDKLEFYFLEMNTRLQVEHPVTEMITGVDLVEEQLRIAAGEPLRYKQEDLSIKGHAIELRIYAEDPTNNFLPDIGTLYAYKPPVGEGIRVDDAYVEGMSIPIYYDPLIAKLAVYGTDRQDAIDNTLAAIESYEISGVQTTLDFGRFTLSHEAFRSGKFDTHFVNNYFRPELLHRDLDEEELQAAAIAAHIAMSRALGQAPLLFEEAPVSPWKIKRLR